MINIKKENQKMIVVFNPIETRKKNFIFLLSSLFFMGIFSYFYGKSNPYSIIKIELLILFLYLIIEIYTEKKIVIYLNKTEIKIYESFYYKKHQKDILTLKYSEIEKLNRVYIGTRASWYSLEVITTNQENITIIDNTSLKEDLQKIIELYEEYRKKIMG